MRHYQIGVLFYLTLASQLVLSNEEIAHQGGEWSAMVGTQLTFGGDTLISLDVEDIFGDIA